MKRLLIFLTLFLIAGSMTAFGYALFRIGMIGGDHGNENTSATSTTDGQPSNKGDRTKDLSWMQEIKGLSDDQATSTKPDQNDLSDTDVVTSTIAQTTSSSVNDSANTEPADDSTGDPVIKDLGKSDALTSTVYDYAFKSLVLSAEMRHGTVFLTWTPATNESFTAYKVIRSTKDENPFYPKTGALKTIKDIAETAYTDSRVNQGETYYYRICMTKKDKPSACGNIIKISF